MQRQNKINAYICPKLHHTITIDIDQGTTPMFLQCPECKLRAVSMMYNVVQNLEPGYEWYKPKEADIIREVKEATSKREDAYDSVLAAMKDHVSNGGLLFRKRHKKPRMHG